MSTTERTVAIILGGGVGSRLYPLTADRSKPAVPIAGKYRLIDIPISNCINSKINKMFVLTQNRRGTIWIGSRVRQMPCDSLWRDCAR